ncbi:MAG: nucleotidyl transferase AbiEii/AbiGii toxin family protein [Gemmatimonadales bacterium]
MDRFLALTLAARTRAFEQAGIERGLSPTSVAKDFWVCLALRQLFALPEFGPHLTFKGGTSLSKAWGLIDRFSEDVDLTIDHAVLGIDAGKEPETANSGKERNRRIDAIKTACRETVEKRIASALTASLAAAIGSRGWSLTIDPNNSDQQTLLFTYPEPPAPDTGRYVRPVVKLEFGARGEPWPAAERVVLPIVAEVFPDLFDSAATTVRALRPERTFWEKMMLLHEERQRPGDRPPKDGMSRHYYDVYRLIENGVAARAVADDALLAQVAAHRKAYFRYGHIDYAAMRRGSIQMLPTPAQLDHWRRDYEAMQREMFVVPPPDFTTVLSTIERFQAEFNAA